MAKKKLQRASRPKKEFPKRCYGNEHRVHHAEGCRPARPLCKWMRRVQPQRRPCCCGAYHYPHRAGSGLCGSPEKMNEFVWGPANAVTEWDERDAIQAEGSVDDDRPSGIYAVVSFDDFSATGSDDDVPF